MKDNGRGRDSVEGGFGIAGLHERIQTLGGAMNVYTSTGNGFSIQISVPYPPDCCD